MAPQASTTAAPQQYKQSSRKSKKAWRKNVDISEVQQGLDTVRDEVIRTGGVIKEKPSDQLFSVDVAGSEEIRKKVPNVVKQLKADHIIAQRSPVPSVDTRKRGPSSGTGTTNGIVTEPSSKKRKTNGVSHRELERLKQRAFGGEAVQKDITTSGEAAAEDPWAEKVVQDDPSVSYLPKKVELVAPKTLREAPVSLLENGKAMPAVAKPRGGISYNPQFEDYEKLIQTEGDKEVKAEKKRIKEAQEEAERQAKIDAAQDEAERSEYYTEDESVWEGIESDYEGAEWASKKRPQRKTPAERNKVKRRKLVEQEARHNARMAERGRRGLKDGSSVAVTKVSDSADGSDKQLVEAAAAESSDDEIDDRKLRRRRFGTIPVPERSLELVLPDELQDSLRLLKPEGNLLKERFRTYMVGGKIETRRPGFQAKKAKRKATEKWTHKDFVVPTGTM